MGLIKYIFFIFALIHKTINSSPAPIDLKFEHTNNSCTSSICLECPSSPSICTHCASGYFLNPDTQGCSSCPEGCTLCESQYACTECSGFRYLDESNTCVYKKEFWIGLIIAGLIFIISCFCCSKSNKTTNEKKESRET